MKNEQNIIELVRGLQEINAKSHGMWIVVEDRAFHNTRIHQFHIDADDGSDEEVTSPIGFYYESDLRMMCALKNSFPTIAQALMIAVEALEECSRIKSYPAIHFKNVADKALSRINHL